MAQPTLPQLIVGPAIAVWNGYSYYFKAGVKVQFKRETFKIMSDFDGEIDERHKAQMTEVSGTPVGMLSSAGIAAIYPYPIGSIGKSIFGVTALPLVITTRFGGASNTGQTITYPRSCVSKTPNLTLHPLSTLFDDITFTCIGNPTVQPSTAGQWNTLVDAAFTDATFDETQIITDTYNAAYGASPYAVMGSQHGFKLEFPIVTENIYSDDYGLTDIILKQITATCSFIPSNLTEANFYALLNAQGTNYVYPGQSLSKLNTNLVLAGSGNAAHTLTATIFNAGPKDCSLEYSTASHRFTALGFTSKRTWTAGVANPLFTLAVA